MGNFEYSMEQYVNSGSVKVSFVVSRDDWYLVQQSENWRRIQNFLGESKNRGNQMSLKEKVNLLEEG